MHGKTTIKNPELVGFLKDRCLEKFHKCLRHRLFRQKRWHDFATTRKVSRSSEILVHPVLCLHAKYEGNGQRECGGGKSQPAAVRENSELPWRNYLRFTKPNNFIYLHAHVLMSCPSSLAFPRQEQNIIFSVCQGLEHQSASVLSHTKSRSRKNILL
jgi:hypothetical protein